MINFLSDNPRLLLVVCLTVLLCLPVGLIDRSLIAQPAAVRPDGKLNFAGVDGKNVAAIIVEIAETEEARRKGLMARPALGMTEGMLFIYKKEDMLGFWMYNTLISLDIIFADADRRIAHMVENTVPLSTQIYVSQRPAQYVVEVPAGFVKRFNIQKGMLIEWRRW